MKENILPNLRSWNDKQRKKRNSKLSIGFYINTLAFEKIEKVFSVLAYSNIINIDYSKKSIGHHQYAYFVSINPSLLFTDLIISDLNKLNSASLAIENNQAYSESSTIIKELIESIELSTNFIECPNKKCSFKTNDDGFKYCPQCGTKIETEEPESLYKILRAHDISNLKLSSKIIERLKSKFGNIGEIYDSDLENIRMQYIQDVRIHLIKNAAIEYMAG